MKNLQNKAQKAGFMRPAGTFSDIQLSNSRTALCLCVKTIQKRKAGYTRNTISSIIPSLTVAEIKNRCIPCVYCGTAIFVIVMKYSNLFFSFAFFLDRSHFAFGYELIISSEAAGFMKIICNGFTLI